MQNKALKTRQYSFFDEKNFKKYITLCWAVGWLTWLPFAAKKAHLDYVHRIYSEYWHYENRMQNGIDLEYTRLGFHKAASRLETADPYIQYFVIIGILIPIAILLTGSWLFRHINKARKNARDPLRTSR
jgi:hypothetical protein